LLTAVVERRNREVLLVEDFFATSADRSKFGWLVSLVHAPWQGREFPRDDVATPAGQFEQAARVTSTERGVETTRWSHPVVPLGGIVKEVTSDYERVLVGFENRRAESYALVHVFNDLELAQRSFREINETGQLWFGIQTGFDSLGTPSDVNQTLGFVSSVGFRVTASFDAVLTVTVIGEVSYPKIPELTESMFLAGGGLRWFPFGRTRLTERWRERARLYGQVDANYAEVVRSPEDATVGRGVALGARVGFGFTQGRDWTYGIEIHDHFALLNSDEGLRHTLGVHAFIQLFGRPWSYTLPW
jgi:hypothetical protein